MSAVIAVLVTATVFIVSGGTLLFIGSVGSSVTRVSQAKSSHITDVSTNANGTCDDDVIASKAHLVLVPSIPAVLVLIAIVACQLMLCALG